MRLVKLLFTFTLMLLLSATVALAQTGKIAGVITDQSTGEVLPGVNVLIEGTLQGAVSDAEGFYFINNVRPGTYTLVASFVGYVTQTTENVRVSTGLTTEVDFSLQDEAVGLDEVTVTAERPIVQLDVSANVASLNPEEFEDLPVSGVSEVLDLQAGIEPGMQVRGGGLGEVAFVVDGLNLRTGRSHEPFTNISYTSIEEVQVQTGGFSAEYGNVRSGIVNVATKEPPRNTYIFDGLFRFAPAQDKSFNALGGPEDCNFSGGDVSPWCDSWYIRPYIDPAVALDGYAGGSWDEYTQRQYNARNDGWNSLAERLRTGEGFDVTANDMLEYFKYTHRKDNTIDSPDYQADVSFGGPLIPGYGDKLRFLASYRGTQTAYMYPQSRDSFDDQTIQLKLTSNLTQGMKLTVQGFVAQERGINGNQNWADLRVYKGNLPAYPWQGSGNQLIDSWNRRGRIMLSDGAFANGDVDHTMIGGTFTHTLSGNTFYEVSLQNISSEYRSRFPNLRDGSFVENGVFNPVLYTNNFGRATPGFESELTCFGGSSDLDGDGVLTPYCVGTEPFGFAGTGGNLLGGDYTTGGHWVKTRDTSDVSVFTGNFRLTSQLNRFLQLKTGAELIISDYNLRYSSVNLALVGPTPTQEVPFSRSPIQGAAFAETKLEFQGMIANLGLRLDYFDPNTEWWVFDPYDQVLRNRVDVLDAALPKESVDAQTFLSPRLGISFPISANSKLYFNYGHFRQMLDPVSVFGIDQSRSGGINRIGNPTHPMPNTVAYELGFDQNIADMFLLRISGFYRDIRDQPRNVVFESLGGVVNYTTFQPWNYEDIRGAEISLTKRSGRWLRGFVNYTYLQSKNGNFGFSNFYENSFAQLSYLRTSTDFILSLPLAQPFARANAIFVTPRDMGQLLGDWRVSLLGEWRSGAKYIWDGLALATGRSATYPELQENVKWKDYWNFDLRFTKHIDTELLGDLQFFVDISNVFGIKHLYRVAAFHPDNRDTEFYLWSLHLPEDIYDDLVNQENLPYIWVPGDDQLGDFRDPDVEFQPIEAIQSLDAWDVTDGRTDRAWFWAKDTGQYSRWNGSSWESVPEGELNDVLDSKAYIDMPNLRFNTFLNPRRYTLGLRFSF